jgi:virginiamycin A acetyltransferase
MRELLRRLWHLYRCNRRRTSHPFITNSWVDDPSGVDASAVIRDSRLHGAVTIGRKCEIEACRIRANAGVAVGDYSALSGPITIVADLNPVQIGKFCSLAPYVAIWEAAHDHGRITTAALRRRLFGASFREDVVSRGAVRIGNDVWIGTGAAVLSGVSIGDGAVIGAGAVVTRDVPAYTIAAGAPARPVKARFPPELVKRLQQLRWWDWSEDEILRHPALFERRLTLDALADL